jgi:thymidylate synthase
MLTGVLANDLDGAWYEVIKNCFDPNHAKKYVIDKGSFEGHTRYQLHSLILQVNFPETRPLSPIMPVGVESPSTDEYIEQYFGEYIMNPNKATNEEYAYGQFIYPHLDNIIEMLTKTPNTNQAVINIGEALTTDGDLYEIVPKVYENPPCLRCITWQYENGKLSLHTFWRSWDVFSGLPTNLGGMQLLNEYIADSCGYETGKMYAYSSGAHVYEYAKPVVETRFGRGFNW